MGQDFREALSLCHGSILHTPQFSRPNYTTGVSKRKPGSKKFKRRHKHRITISEKQADNIADNLVSRL